MDAAPIPQILPSFLPIQIEQALAGYYEVLLQVEGERRLTEPELRQVIGAASFLGTQLYCTQIGFDLSGDRGQAGGVAQSCAGYLRRRIAKPYWPRWSGFIVIRSSGLTTRWMIGSRRRGGESYKSEASMNILGDVGSCGARHRHCRCLKGLPD